jgi:hypothetical protein
MLDETRLPFHDLPILTPAQHLAVEQDSKESEAGLPASFTQ